MIKFLKSLFVIKKRFVYSIQYRVSMKMSNGATRDTSIINVSIPANTKDEAIELLKAEVKKKVTVRISQIVTNNIPRKCLRNRQINL